MPWLVASALIMSVSFGLIGNTLAGCPPTAVATVRFILAAAFFSLFTRWTSWRDALTLTGIGAIQFGVMSIAYLTSFRYLASHEVALLTAFTPVYVLLFGDLFTWRLPLRIWLAALLAVASAICLLWYGTLVPSLIGFCLIETANATFALGQVLYRRFLSKSVEIGSETQHFFWLLLGGLICAAVADAIVSPHFGVLHLIQSLRPLQYCAVLYLGICVTGVSFFLWNRGARRVSLGTLAVMNNLKIPLGLFVSLVCFGEKVEPLFVIVGLSLFVVAWQLTRWEKPVTKM